MTSSRQQHTMVMISHFLLTLASAALPVRPDKKSELDRRVLSLGAKFEILQQHPEHRIPAFVLRKAHGIILLDRGGSGVPVGHEDRSGVALAKDTQTGSWSPVAFLKADDFSLGFPIGGEQSFFVILLMNGEAPRFLTDPRFEFGALPRGESGESGAEGLGTISGAEQPLLVFSSGQGLYSGAVIKAEAFTPDEQSNRIYYEQSVGMAEVLYGHELQRPPAAAYLAARISAYANPTPP
jgi:lipid-binding SYLF domain-containing protein